RRSEIQAWVKGRSEVLSPATVELAYRYLASIFRAAVGDRLIPATPCEGIRLPKKERERVIPLDTEQVMALADAVPDRYRALIITAAGTGLRQGEAFGLTLENVNFLGRRLTVSQQLVALAHGSPFLGPPKTERADERCRCPT
ncbi:MAG: site-specific integrase, partial [Acidimicrobiia bacterium]